MRKLLNGISKIIDEAISRLLGKYSLRTFQMWLLGKQILQAEKTKTPYHEISFVQATEDNRDKLAKKFDITSEEKKAIDYAELHGAEYITKMGNNLKGNVRGIVIKGMENQLHPHQIERQLRDTFKTTIDRDWRRIAVTETAMAVNHGYLASISHIKGMKVIGSESVDACPYCNKLTKDKVFDVVSPGKRNKDWDKEVWVGKTNVGRKAADWKPTIPLHPNCFSGETLVLTPTGHKRIDSLNIGDYVIGHSGKAKRVLEVHNTGYVGNLLSVNTAFSCTLNHPIAIDGRGWVEAERIKKGDHMLSAKSIVLNPDTKNTPAKSCKKPFLAKVLSFFSRSAVPTTTVNFNGDFLVGDSDVDIIFPNGKQSDSINIVRSKELEHHFFSYRESLRLMNPFSSFFKLCQRTLSATNFIVSRLNLFFSLLWRHFSPLKLFRITTGSNRESKVNKPLCNSVPRNTSFFGKLLKRISLLPVSLMKSLGVKVDFKCNHTLLYHTVGVETITVCQFDGNVYNLTVEDDETYLVGKENILVHNCRGRWLPLYPFQEYNQKTGRIELKKGLAENPTLSKSIGLMLEVTETLNEIKTYGINFD